MKNTGMKCTKCNDREQLQQGREKIPYSNQRILRVGDF